MIQITPKLVIDKLSTSYLHVLIREFNEWF